MAHTRRRFSPTQLRALREQRGWSMTMLAAHVGVSEQSVRLWESGTYKPGTDTYALLCELLATDQHGHTDYGALFEEYAAPESTTT